MWSRQFTFSARSRGASEVRPDEHGTLEVRAAQPGLSEVRAGEVSPAKVRAVQIERSGERAAAEHGQGGLHVGGSHLQDGIQLDPPRWSSIWPSSASGSGGYSRPEITVSAQASFAAVTTSAAASSIQPAHGHRPRRSATVGSSATLASRSGV